MKKLIILLIALSFSAFAEDYQIFNSLEDDLEVSQTVSSKFKEQKIDKKDFCSGDYKVIAEAPIHTYSGCFDRNSIIQTVEFSKFDRAIIESNFLSTRLV